MSTAQVEPAQLDPSRGSILKPAHEPTIVLGLHFFFQIFLLKKLRILISFNLQNMPLLKSSSQRLKLLLFINIYRYEVH